MKVCFIRLICLLCILIYVIPASAEPVKKNSKKNSAVSRRISKPVKNNSNVMKVALVIGNSAYPSSPLKNPVNDARAMSLALRKLGFNVIEKTDAGYTAMHEVLENFGSILRKGGVGLFYFAGHGIQLNGSNYLVPVDSNIKSEQEARYKAIDTGLILAKMENAENKLNIVILDACRDNPFARSFRSGNKGLAHMDAPKGSLIAYSTAPGKTASDGNGKNGLYTQELLKHLQTPGITLETLFKRVRNDVMTQSGDTQTPWESSFLTEDFCFIDSTTTENNIQQSRPAGQTVHAGQIEQELWESIKDSNSAEPFNDYIRKYPEGRYAAPARILIAKFRENSNTSTADENMATLYVYRTELFFGSGGAWSVYNNGNFLGRPLHDSYIMKKMPSGEINLTTDCRYSSSEKLTFKAEPKTTYYVRFSLGLTGCSFELKDTQSGQDAVKGLNKM